MFKNQTASLKSQNPWNSTTCIRITHLEVKSWWYKDSMRLAIHNASIVAKSSSPSAILLNMPKKYNYQWISVLKVKLHLNMEHGLLEEQDLTLYLKSNKVQGLELDNRHSIYTNAQISFHCN